MIDRKILAGLLAFLVVVSTTAWAADDANKPVEVDGATIGRFGDPATVDEENFKFSDAETKLWLADHLKNIGKPMRLKYDFVKSGSYEDGFTDTVLLDIRTVNKDGTKDADMQFFTGDRAQPFSPDNVTAIRGNPVLGIYLRGDVYDMSRLTSGSWRYFQRRIKLALSEAATIEPVEISYGGKKVKAQRVVIAPYQKDPHSAQIQQFTGKRYEFTFSDDVPGSLYEIHTIVPGAKEGEPPLLEERLTLGQAGASPGAGK